MLLELVEVMFIVVMSSFFIGVLLLEEVKEEFLIGVIVVGLFVFFCVGFCLFSWLRCGCLEGGVFFLFFMGFFGKDIVIVGDLIEVFK